MNSKIQLLLAVTALTACAGAPERRDINLPGRSLSAVYSNAVQVGDTVYLSGKLGLDPETGAVPSSIEDEVRNALDGLAEVLAAAELEMNDLVSVTVYCTDPALYDQFNAIYATYFDGTFPTRAFIGSGPLLRGAHFEVKGIAVRSR
ncbi:MAG: Rid family hydrolase [Planctomycetota bacterium]